MDDPYAKSNKKRLWFSSILLFQHMKNLLSELEVNKEIGSSGRRCCRDFLSQGIFVNASIPKITKINVYDLFIMR